MKYLFLIFLLLLSCKTTEKDFYHRKYQKETSRSYREKRGLMLLENTQLGRNKYYWSGQNKRKMKTAQRKYHKQ